MLDVRRLVLLRELSIRGTIAAVAEAVNFTPSAVSQQLSALEREAGVQLFRKAGRLPSPDPSPAIDPAELDEVVPPDRALPVELQVAQPAGVDQQRGAGAVHGVGDLGPVDGAAEADLLTGRGCVRSHTPS